MRGAIPLLPNTTLWRGAQLKHRDNFTVYIYIYMYMYILANYTIK